MNERDLTLLGDMLDMSRKAQQFLNNQPEEALVDNEILAFALVRTIEIIGEAASRVGQDTRESLPGIPWKAVIGMRNKVIHNYASVNYQVVWKTVVEDLPPLIAELEKALPPETPAPRRLES